MITAPDLLTISFHHTNPINRANSQRVNVPDLKNFIICKGSQDVLAHLAKELNDIPARHM